MDKYTALIIAIGIIGDPKAKTQAINDRNDGIRELIGAGMYQALLYDRAPKEQLVISKEENSKSLYVRSKFFDEVTPYAEVVQKPKEQKIEGFEKVIAACHMLGELDYHGNNIMVQKSLNNEGKEIDQLVKIDHGRSFVAISNNFASMIDKTSKTFEQFGYDRDIKSDKISFDIQKYSENLNQMIAQFDENHINNIVDQKIADLKKAGFNPEGTDLTYSIDLKKGITLKANNFEELSANFKNLIKQNLEGMKDIAKNVEIISKFEGVSPEFKNGGWLQEFSKSASKDPIAYAIQNNIKIEGKEPQVWAKENSGKVNIETSSAKPQTLEEQWQKNPETGGWEDKKPKLIIPDIEELVSQTADNVKNGKKLTELQVKEFYDDLLILIKENNFITDDQHMAINNGQNLKDAIKETTKLVNLTTKLSVKDRLCFKAAKFCEKIKLPKLSEYFKNKVEPKIQIQIQNTEKALMQSLKINSLLSQSGKVTNTTNTKINTFQNQLNQRISNKSQSR